MMGERKTISASFEASLREAPQDDVAYDGIKKIVILRSRQRRRLEGRTGLFRASAGGYSTRWETFLAMV